MTKGFRIPFTKLDKNAYNRLIIVAICAFYLVHIIFGIVNDSFLKGFGTDFLAFWSAGKIADEKGYPFIYDIENQRNTQLAERRLLSALPDKHNLFPTLVPSPIFPIFVVPFQLLSKMGSLTGYLLWTSINLVALIGYLIFFQRKVRQVNLFSAPKNNILFLMLISFPVFTNFREGQVKVFLLICIGEFIRAAISKKPILAGAWLGGLLLNPQLLILIVPAFFILRNWKVIIGFCLSSGVVLVVSLLLSGFKGMESMISLWTKYIPGMASNNPENMMNWRMLALQINYYFTPPTGWVIAGLGILLTLLLCSRIVRYGRIFGSSQWIMVTLGMFAATCAVTWHSHIHMAMVLIPFLIYAFENNLLSDRLLFFWVSFTPLVFIGEYILDFFIILRIIPAIKINATFLGLSGLILNILLVFAVFCYLRKVRPELLNLDS